MPFKDPQRAKECSRLYYLERKKRSQSGYIEPQIASRDITLLFAYQLLRMIRKAEYARIKQAEYYANDPEKARATRRKCYHRNPEKHRQLARAWALSHPEKVRVRQRKHYEDNKELYLSRANASQIELRKTPQKKLRDSLAARIYSAVKKGNKSAKTLELLGCNIEYLRSHLEKQFLPGMTWENYGYRGWHIDHKRPCASFDLTLAEQQKQCFHYTNLQPLWMQDNFRKGDKCLENV